MQMQWSKEKSNFWFLIFEKKGGVPKKVVFVTKCGLKIEIIIKSLIHAIFTWHVYI